MLAAFFQNSWCKKNLTLLAEILGAVSQEKRPSVTPATSHPSKLLSEKRALGVGHEVMARHHMPTDHVYNSLAQS